MPKPRSTVALLLTLGLLVAGCEERPSSRVAKVGIQGLDLDKVTLRFDVQVDNPYPVPLPLSGVSYTLSGAGEPFLSGSLDEMIRVPARSSHTFSMPLDLTFRQLRRAAARVEPGSLYPYTADIKINVEAPAVGTLVLPIQHNGQIPIPAPPRVALGEIHWKGLSPTEARADVTLEITNPNPFALDLLRLTYRLGLAGHDVADGDLLKSVTFSPNVAQTLPIGISFNPLRFGTAVFDALTGGDIDYQIEGTLDAGTEYGELTLPLRALGKVLSRK